MSGRNGKPAGKVPNRFRCAIYTRKSTEDGLEQEFNSLDAARRTKAGNACPTTAMTATDGGHRGRPDRLRGRGWPNNLSSLAGGRNAGPRTRATSAVGDHLTRRASTSC